MARGQSCRPRTEHRLQVSGQGSGLRLAQGSQRLTPEESRFETEQGTGRTGTQWPAPARALQKR